MVMAMMIIDIVDDDGNDAGENVAERDSTTVGLRFFQNGMVEQYPDYKSAFFFLCSDVLEAAHLEREQ